MSSSMFSPALHEVVRRLDARSEHTPTSLADALRGSLTIDDVTPWIRFSAENYVRNLVTCGSSWELRLLCWRPHQSSSLHGHGPAACAFRVLSGSATETILGERDRTWAPGDVIEEGRERLVHQVGNAGGDALLTLHAYSPQLPVDAPSPRGGREIVIVGGGFSGVAAAIHLLRRGHADLRITVVERGPWLGRGVAYGVDSSVFRLNVPASRMSLDPEDPSDFVRWAGVEHSPHAFLPRTTFGAYVVDRFNQALRASPTKLRLVRGTAVGAIDGRVTLADGRQLAAERVILATGIAPRITPSSLVEDARVVDAWDEVALAALPKAGRVLVLGSGLTALDVIAFLGVHRFAGEVTVMSRRGLFPRPHAPPGHGAPLDAAIASAAPRELPALIRWARAVVRDAIEAGHPWQYGIDALRPHVSMLWRRMSPQDRARFSRFVRPYWDVLRHRAPTDTLDLVDTWRRSGRLRFQRGQIARVHPRADHLDVEVRSGDATMLERYDAIVRCIGPAIEGLDSATPLVKALVEAGLAAPDPAGLGIVTDGDGRVMGPDGSASSRLFALGALRRASDWETTAVPEITRHAHALARTLEP